MDWIKVEHALPSKPEVLGLASFLDIDTDTALGICVRVFIWFDQQTADGVTPLTPDCFDRFFGRPGLTDGLISVGWLVYDQGQLQMRDFATHCSETAKTRAHAARRQARHRLKSAPAADCDTSHAQRVTPPLPEPEKNRTRTEPELKPSAGSLKAGSQSREGPSVFAPLRTADLRSVDNLTAWLVYQAKQPNRIFTLDAETKHRTLRHVVGAAVRALAVGERPVRLFASIVGKRDWSKISDEQDATAGRLIAANQQGAIP